MAPHWNVGMGQSHTLLPWTLQPRSHRVGEVGRSQDLKVVTLKLLPGLVTPECEQMQLSCC